MSNIIELNHVDYSYGKNRVLCDISFDIAAKSILFIMGNNGSGKTTLVKCMLNNLAVQSGCILVDGECITGIPRTRFAKMVSYVPQNINIICDFKVKDYLVLGRNPYIKHGNPGKIDYELVGFYARKTGVENILEQPFSSLSGGQKQWCAITRALIQETKIIVMDEPMSALDMGKQAELLVLLNELNESDGKTIVLTTHNPNHCFMINSTVCLLHNQKVHSIGHPKRVFTQENITEIYGKYVSLINGNIVEITI